MSQPRPYRIVALHMLTESGGVGVHNKYTLRNGSVDGVLAMEDSIPGVRVTLQPPKTLAGSGGKRVQYLVPWSALRYVEYEVLPEAEVPQKA